MRGEGNNIQLLLVPAFVQALLLDDAKMPALVS